MPRCWWATIASITTNDYNLAAGRYKPQITGSVPDEDPTTLLEESLILEQEILRGLDSLLKEIRVVK
jgi:type I restriction enzyme M protein